MHKLDDACMESDHGFNVIARTNLDMGENAMFNSRYPVFKTKLEKRDVIEIFLSSFMLDIHRRINSIEERISDIWRHKYITYSTRTCMCTICLYSYHTRDVTN